MKDWYTVPRWYGGLTFPLWKRMMLEWLWRRHGEDGLQWYANRIHKRMAKSLGKVAREFDQMTGKLRRATSAFEDFRDVMDIMEGKR